MTDIVQGTIAFIQQHQLLGSAVVFLLAFCESFAFVSLLVPATGILFGVGGLMGAAGIAFWPIWTAAVLGAVAGDWLAYELAFRARDYVLAARPFADNPHIMHRATELIGRWGMIAVFIGRFFGPLRAVVPIAAGICEMPWWRFQIANLASALLWASAILTPGFLGMRWLVG
jgi:membrane protein DedA with SNARE-associated domain